MKKERQSNLELLKIIAMFLICASHVINAIIHTDTFPNYSLETKQIIYTLFKNLGWIGDYIFIACSAYFLVGYKKINIRKIVLYYLDVALLLMAYYGVFILLNIDGTKELFFLTFTTLLVGKYWYILHYLIFLILLPFLNVLIEKLPQKTHRILTFLVIPVEFVFLIFSQLNIPISWSHSLVFCFMVLIMSYGKKYGTYLWFKEDNKKSLVIGLFVALTYVVLANVVGNILGYYGYSFIKESFAICDLRCPAWYIVGITLFLLFKNLNIKQSKFINYISSLSLIFYIAHHNRFTSLMVEPLLIKHIEMYPNIPITLYWVFTIARFIFGIVIAIIFFETIHRLLKFLTSIKLKKEEKENNA